MLGKYRVGMIPLVLKRKHKLIDNYKENNKRHPGRKNKWCLFLNSAINVMTEKRTEAYAQFTETWKKIIGLMWVASRACGRRGDWRDRIKLVIKELLHLPGIYRPLNWKVIWSDVKLYPFNSNKEDLLKISDQLRGSCNHAGKRWVGGDVQF